MKQFPLALGLVGLLLGLSILGGGCRGAIAELATITPAPTLGKRCTIACPFSSEAADVLSRDPRVDVNETSTDSEIWLPAVSLTVAVIVDLAAGSLAIRRLGFAVTLT